MNRFEKVSYTQFRNDVLKLFPIYKCYTFELEEIYQHLKLPLMATSGSMGSDFFLPFDINIGIGEAVTIPTGIKVQMEEQVGLLIFPRSSFGFKYEATIVNTVPVGDRDYYNNEDNEGHYMIKIRNKDIAPIKLKAGDRYCQGVMLPYIIPENSKDISRARTGGIGSTGE